MEQREKALDICNQERAGQLWSLNSDVRHNTMGSKIKSIMKVSKISVEDIHKETGIKTTKLKLIFSDLCVAEDEELDMICSLLGFSLFDLQNPFVFICLDEIKTKVHKTHITMFIEED